MFSKVKAVIAGLIIGSVGGCATESAPAATGNLSVQQRCESLQSLTAEGVDLAITAGIIPEHSLWLKVVVGIGLLLCCGLLRRSHACCH